MLKQLKISLALRNKTQERERLEAVKAAFLLRNTELEASSNETESEEDLNTIIAEVEKLEKEMKDADIDNKLTEVNIEIEGLEKQLEEIQKEEKPKEARSDEKGKEGNKMNKFQMREALKTGTYYERTEVKSFYEQLINIRSVSGADILIPEIVINRIMDIVGDYSIMYRLVNKVKVKGKTRIILDTDTTEATWIEQTGTIPTGDVGTPFNVTFDGYKVGKIVFVDNSIMQDSIINLDDYVVKKIARAIAKALDKAILNGRGDTNKEPEGILTKLPESQKKTVNNPRLVDIIKPISLIDSGEDSTGEIVAVMKRQTFYNRLLEFTIQTDSSGNVVGKLPNLQAINILGLKTEFSQYVPEDTILFGEFEEYTLVEREDITVDNSIHVKFAEDQTAFRGKGRFDGKMTKPKSFVEVKMTFDETEPGAKLATR